LATAFGLTLGNQLVSFDTADPEDTLVGPVAISGLVAGETVVGIDFRPATGTLFAVTNASRVYSIDVNTRVATQAGTTAFTPAGSGTIFAVDFNPIPDRIRFVTDAAQNLRLNPANGAATADTNLAYAAGDVAAGATPRIVAVAYDRNFTGTSAVSLYGIDASRNTLVLIGSANGSPNSPNGGQLTTVGSLGVDAGDLTGFDIGPDGAAYATITESGEDTTSLFRINLQTGAASQVDEIGDDDLFVRDIAVVTPNGQRNLDFIRQVYVDLLGRTIDTGGQNTWLTSLNAGATRTQVVAAIQTSTEYRTRELNQLYQALLGRPIDGSGLNTWLGLLASGGTLEQVAVAVLSSPEFFQASGSTNAGFLSQFYQVVLGRPIDGSGMTTWTNALNAGASRAAVSQAILDSAEANQRLVQMDYAEFLRRTADPTGLSGFTGALNDGATNDAVVAAMLGSDEYFSRVPFSA
jgi:hypothetical protein